MSSRLHAQKMGRILREAKHIVLRGVPLSATSRDLRKMVSKADIKGVTDVSLYYRHFRPTGKAVLTMSLPDYTRDALRDAESIIVPGSKIEAEPIDQPGTLNIRTGHSAIDETPNLTTGTGPGAGVPEGKTVTITGVPGRKAVSDITYLLKGFRLAQGRRYPVQIIPQPPRKFTLYSRFVIFLESESEAQRFVRKTHMTRYKNLDDAPILRASVIS